MRKEAAASYLGVSLRTLQRLMSAGRIAFQLHTTPTGGRLAVFDQAELDRYRAERDDRNTAAHSAMIVSPPSSSPALVSSDLLAAFLARLSPATKPAPALLLTLKQASTWSGLPRKFLRQAIERGELRAIRIGKVARVSADELRAFARAL